MKHLFSIFMMSVSLFAFSQSQKVIETSVGEPILNFVRETPTTYVGDDFGNIREVSKSNHRVVTYSPQMGKGWITPKKPGEVVNIRKQPNVNSKIIFKLDWPRGHSEGTSVKCVGEVGEWYKVDIYDGIGYIRKDVAKWLVRIEEGGYDW